MEHRARRGRGLRARRVVLQARPGHRGQQRRPAVPPEGRRERGHRPPALHGAQQAGKPAGDRDRLPQAAVGAGAPEQARSLRGGHEEQRRRDLAHRPAAARPHPPGARHRQRPDLALRRHAARRRRGPHRRHREGALGARPAPDRPLRCDHAAGGRRAVDRTRLLRPALQRVLHGERRTPRRDPGRQAAGEGRRRDGRRGDGPPGGTLRSRPRRGREVVRAVRRTVLRRCRGPPPRHAVPGDQQEREDRDARRLRRSRVAVGQRGRPHLRERRGGGLLLLDADDGDAQLDHPVGVRAGQRRRPHRLLRHEQDRGAPAAPHRPTSGGT